MKSLPFSFKKKKKFLSCSVLTDLKAGRSTPFRSCRVVHLALAWPLHCRTWQTDHDTGWTHTVATRSRTRQLAAPRIISPSSFSLSSSSSSCISPQAPVSQVDIQQACGQHSSPANRVRCHLLMVLFLGWTFVPQDQRAAHRVTSDLNLSRVQEHRHTDMRGLNILWKTTSKHLWFSENTSLGPFRGIFTTAEGKSHLLNYL